MSDRKPTDDLKEGLGLLFRAARGLAKEATPETAEKAVSDGARELLRIVNDVGRAIGSELGKSFGGASVVGAPKGDVADAKPPVEANPPPGAAAPAPPPDSPVAKHD